MATAEATSTGISFALTDEQKALRELAHEFAEQGDPAEGAPSTTSTRPIRPT